MLSIITPIYRGSKYLIKYLHRISNQTSNDFENIFVIDTGFENCLGKINDFKFDIKGKIKIIFNTRRMGRWNAVLKGIKHAEGDHIIINSITDSFKDDLVEKIKNINQKENSEIIEFNARIHKPIWFPGEVRREIIFNGDDKKRAELFAYTYPFEFNKIFKTKLLKRVINYSKIYNNSLNSRFALEILFKAILLCSSYKTISKKLIRTKRNTDKTFNPLKIIREWDKLMGFEVFQKYKTALNYNNFFSIKILYEAIGWTTKNTTLMTKLNEITNHKFDRDFLDSNVFLLTNNKEAKLLKFYINKKSHKAYKEL